MGLGQAEQCFDKAADLAPRLGRIHPADDQSVARLEQRHWN
jgi:hypothetical protein